MTEKLYWKDAYMKEFEASVVNIVGNRLTLDKTAFYPASGGQINDTGTIITNRKEYKVTDVKKEGDNVIHITNSMVDAKQGDTVKGMIDWDKRYMHMRLHTAIHVIDGVIVTKQKIEGFSTGSQIYDDRARVDFDMPTLNKETSEKIVEEANGLLAEGHRVYAKELSKEEALRTDNLSRTEPGRALIKTLDVVRVVSIEGFDEQADGGTHVANTKEVGRIKLTKFENKGSHSKRIEFVVENL